MVFSLRSFSPRHAISLAIAGLWQATRKTQGEEMTLTKRQLAVLHVLVDTGGSLYFHEGFHCFRGFRGCKSENRVSYRTTNALHSAGFLEFFVGKSGLARRATKEGEKFIADAMKPKGKK